MNASKFGCVLGYPGPLPCRGCPPSCPEHPEAARPAGELAADLDAIQRVFEMYGVNLTPVNMLVARVADLEAQVAALTQERDDEREEYAASLDAASAGIAKQERHVDTLLVRAEAAEAALANTRQALADANEVIRRVAEGDMPEGGVTWLHGKSWRINLAREYIARRSPSGASDNTVEPKA